MIRSLMRRLHSANSNSSQAEKVWGNKCSRIYRILDWIICQGVPFGLVNFNSFSLIFLTFSSNFSQNKASKQIWRLWKWTKIQRIILRVKTTDRCRREAVSGIAMSTTQHLNQFTSFYIYQEEKEEGRSQDYFRAKRRNKGVGCLLCGFTRS